MPGILDKIGRTDLRLKVRKEQDMFFSETRFIPITIGNPGASFSPERKEYPVEIFYEYSEFSSRENGFVSHQERIQPGNGQVTFIFSSDNNWVNFGLKEPLDETDIRLNSPKRNVWCLTQKDSFYIYLRNLKVYGIVEGLEFMYYAYVDGKLQIIRFSGPSQIGINKEKPLLAESSIFTPGQNRPYCYDSQYFAFKITDKLKVSNYFPELKTVKGKDLAKSSILKGETAAMSFEDLYKAIWSSAAHVGRWFTKRATSYPIGIFLNNDYRLPVKFKQPYACYLIGIEEKVVELSQTDRRNDGYELKLLDPYTDTTFTITSRRINNANVIVKGIFNPFVEETR